MHTYSENRLPSQQGGGGLKVTPRGWGAGVPVLSRWDTMRLVSADQMHIALTELRDSYGPIFILPYATMGLQMIAGCSSRDSHVACVRVCVWWGGGGSGQCRSQV
jgi:hypothetical protein